MPRTTIPTHQNLITRSEDFSHASWNAHSNVTITTAAAMAPDGTTTANLITPNGGVSRHYAGQAISMPAAYQHNPRRMSYSCFVKAGTTQWVMIGDDRHTSFVFAWFDVVNGVIGSVTADNDTGIRVVNGIEALPNAYFPGSPAGWYRCLMSYVMVSPSGGAGPNASSICIGPASGDGVQSHDSALGLTMYGWGAQMVAAALNAGPYQQTVAAAVNTGSIRSVP